MRQDIRDSQESDKKNHLRVLQSWWTEDEDAKKLDKWYQDLWKIKRPLGSYEEAIQMQHVTLKILFGYLFGQLYQMYLHVTIYLAINKMKKDWGKVQKKQQYEIVNVETLG